ncbi:MAG: hypothetical protein KJ915_05385 [Candidatus Omnitrophica bacterium]|nr:hypothetical protein [Candidatus Omnitrophota bacterium]
MDIKVKITLITTSVLLVLIISTGLYNTLNPKISSIVEIKPVITQSSQNNVARVRPKLGEKSNLPLKLNDYYFPQRNTVKAKVDPNGALNQEEQEEDAFFEPEQPKPFDIIADFDDDYVQAPDAAGSMDLNPSGDLEPPED